MRIESSVSYKTVYRPASVSEERLDKIEYIDGLDLEKLDRILAYLCGTAETVKYHKKYNLFSEEFMTVDTEASTIPYNDTWYGFLYSYQILISNTVFLLRERNDFFAFMYRVSHYFHDHGRVMVCYVHNLSYEWQFFKTMLEIDRESVFALQSRKIAKFSLCEGALEFRCSYLLSNMSLEKFTENYCEPTYRKDKELIDYEIIRYPWSDLTQEVIYYSLMDVITLKEAIKVLMHREGDNLKSIPMTNTGYVRRACRLACLGENTKNYKTDEEKESYKKFLAYRKVFKKTALTVDQYNLLVRAFRGGNTHANRFYAGRILPDDPNDEKQLGHADFASSYPAQIICSDQFPMGRLMECTDALKTPEDIDYYAERYWVIMDVVFLDLELKDPYRTTCPYIPLAKTNRSNHKPDAGVFDNGRIIEMPGAVEFCFLGIEWAIIRQQYQGRFIVKKAYYCLKGYLPDQLRMACFDWYEKKTSLKGVKGSEYEYMKSKNRVNAIFGMSTERIVKQIMEVTEDLQIKMRKPTDEEAQEQLDNFYTPMQRKFMAYQWGVTITALARAEHMRLIGICGEDFVYGDTDSVFYLNPEKHAADIEAYNQKWIAYISRCGVPYRAYTRKGEEQILGIADMEDPVDRFVTLGAKKYVTEIDGKLEITVAGVPKKAGAALLGKIENFKPGFMFYVGDDASLEERQSWKKTLHYHDDTVINLWIDGHRLEIRSGIGITRAPYKLDITGEYNLLIGYDEIYCQDDVYGV